MMRRLKESSINYKDFLKENNLESAYSRHHPDNEHSPESDEGSDAEEDEQEEEM